MKKAGFLFLLLLVVLMPVLSGQQVFAPLNAVWHYSYGTDEYTGYTLQKVAGDTTIAGKVCRKVNRTLYRYDLSNPSLFVDSSKTSVYLNMSNDTVFYYNGYFSRFLPLYIFNVAMGDTLVYQVPEPLPGAPQDTLFRIVIDSIRTVTVNGVPLKRVFNTALDGWGFYGSRSGSYTQLLGAEEGLAVHANGVTTTNIMRPVIRCYRDNVINYIREPGGICEGTNGITYLQNGTPIVEIYPVPARDLLYIKMKDRNQAIQSVYLTDMAGRQVPCRRSLKTQQEATLYVDNLASGIYLIHISAQDKQLVRKITLY
ncbi:T9SS type A sorting domain-containing protein [Taibaiella koreensis]|uniref:T9SS type A sorting domain-containing protein n=1 Tax=Taibaiella koreensis TaxID=1268548 RepID=UPI0013C2C66F|nr:T9SS type A sorting domain-containing protein [Taibaiella koreensis]